MTEIQIDAEQRRRLQITALTEMFDGLGSEATDEKLAFYLRLLGAFPPLLLRDACAAAVLARIDPRDSGFPPGPGEIAHHARRIAAERRAAEREREQRALFASARAEVAACLKAGADPAPPQFEATVTDLTARFGMPTAPRNSRRELVEQARRIAREES